VINCATTQNCTVLKFSALNSKVLSICSALQSTAQYSRVLYCTNAKVAIAKRTVARELRRPRLGEREKRSLGYCHQDRGNRVKAVVIY
jgi:hypothetical protein